MASSGWQGRNTLKTSSFGYDEMKGDIYISSISHNGDNITINGKFGVYYDASYGYAYYYYPINAKITGQGGYTQVASGYQYIYAGQYSAQADFSTTINVGASSTSTTVAVEWSYNNGTAYNVYYYTLSYDASTRTLKVTGTNVTFDLKVNGNTVASDSSYYSASVVSGSSYQVSDIKAKSGYYYTGATSASGTVNSNTSLSYAANGRAYAFNVNVKRGASEDTSGGTGTFDYSINSAAGGTLTGNDVSDYYNSALPSGSTYTISDIKETDSAYYYYTGQTSYSGTATAATTIDLPFAAVVAPSGLTVTESSHTTTSITWRVAVSSYGAPGSATGRTIKLYTSGGTLIGTITNASSGYITQQVSSCASGSVYAVANNTHTTTTSSNVSYDLSQYGYPDVSNASFTTVDATTATVTMSVSEWNGYCDSSQGYFTYSYVKNGQTVTGQTTASTNKTATVTLSNLTTDEIYTLSWTAHNTAGNSTVGDSIEFHSVRTPGVPSIVFAFTNMNRTCTITVTAGTIYDTATLASTVVELSLDSSFSTILDTFTFPTSSYNYVKQYVKPFSTIYARARTTNSLSMTSPYSTTSTFAPRIIWGVANIAGDGKYDIVDIRKLRTNGTLTPANWIEGTLYGKNRIVKKVG